MKLNSINRKRIVIINLPTQHLKSDTDIMARGPLSVHSFLKNNGIDSILFDLAGSRDELWYSIPDSDLYGISSVTCQINYAEKLAKYLKNRNPKAIIVMGGAHPIAMPEDCLLNRNADITVNGEGEECMLELMSSNKELDEVPGFRYVNDQNQIINTGDWPIQKDIEKFYPLKFEDYGVYKYLKNGVYEFFNKENEDLQFNVMISRGCYSKCKFCMSGLTGKNGIRFRNIKNAVDELIYFKERYGITRVYFDDDEMLTNKSMLNQLCSEMKRSGLHWLCLGRTDMINEQKIEKMIDAGCVGIVYGVEHFSDRVLTGLNKRNTGQQNYDALLLTAKYNLKVRAQMMTGCLPYETWDDVKLNAEYIKKIIDQTNGKVKFSFHIFQPLPGTRSYIDALNDPDNFVPERLTDFTEFQTVGDFQLKENQGGNKRPIISHRNKEQVYEWYDYLISCAGNSEIGVNKLASV